MTRTATRPLAIIHRSAPLVALVAALASCTIQGGVDEDPGADADTQTGEDTSATDTGSDADTDTDSPPDVASDVGLDGGVDTSVPDTPEDVPPDVEPDTPPSPGELPVECHALEPMPWNTTETHDLANWATFGDGTASCFEPRDGEGRRAFFAVALPARHALEFTMRRVSGEFYMYLGAAADHCAEMEPNACDFIWKNGFVGANDESTSFIVTNDGDTERVFVVRAEAERFEEPVAGEVVIETRILALADNATCEEATELPPDTTVTTGHGSAFEYCGWQRPNVFYRVTVPPMTRAASESYALSGGKPDCGCAGFEQLHNASDTPLELIVELSPEETVSWTAHPLEPHARCETAAVLSPDQPGAGRFDDGGDHRTTCSSYGDSEHPLFWTLEIPPTSRAVIAGELNISSGDMAFLLRSQTGCNVETCNDRVETTGPEATLTVDNPDDGPISVVISAAVGFAPPPGVEVRLTVTYEPLP